MKDNILDDKLVCAAAALQAGELVAFPTETVYGLGGNALSDAAVAAIYAVKDRPIFNPLIVHVHSITAAQKYVQWNERAQILAENFWPGPLTLVLPRKKDCSLSLLASAGLDFIAVRIPAHPIALALLEKSQLPLAAPSANRSGRISPTLASHVVQELGGMVKMILDGGACGVGIESTIVDISDKTASILRHGKITRENLEKYIEIGEYNSDIIKASGMLKSHYAPMSGVRLNAIEIFAGEALLSFGAPFSFARNNTDSENLSESGNLEEAAANLFRMLRLLDAKNPSAIAVMPIPEIGIGIAINDRLRRAAAPRNAT